MGEPVTLCFVSRSVPRGFPAFSTGVTTQAYSSFYLHTQHSNYDTHTHSLTRGPCMFVKYSRFSLRQRDKCCVSCLLITKKKQEEVSATSPLVSQMTAAGYDAFSHVALKRNIIGHTNCNIYTLNNYTT